MRWQRSRSAWKSVHPMGRSSRRLRISRAWGRRFQRYGEIALAKGGNYTLIDDTAITLPRWRQRWPRRAAHFPAAAWCWRSSRIAIRARVTASRILCACCPTVDALLLTEVYAAGEAPIVAADGRALARAVRVQGKVEPVFVEHVAEFPER